MYIDNIISFNNIEVNVTGIEKKRIIGNIKIDGRDFKLIFTYNDEINVNENIAGLILTMPVINFTYFSRKLTLNYPVSENDRDLINKFMKINAHEVFINKIINRRYDFIKEEYLPEEKDINEYNASGITELVCNKNFDDNYNNIVDKQKVMIMSSSGKESLLAYGIFNEINSNDKNYSFYFEESGSHWLTAKTAYDYYNKNFNNVKKVWSNADRFYHETLKYIKIIKMENIDIRSDDYPITVFIFPVYIFLLIPLLLKYNIGNIIMGDELDDPREMNDFHGLKYYYGIFDQTYDFNEMISEYFKNKKIGSYVYSVVYPVTGYMEEKILMDRYHSLYLNQRSCHSCHEKDNRIYPCGKCSKCLGILLFIDANNGNPQEILYNSDDVRLLKKRVKNSRLRLDPDEINYTEMKLKFIDGNYRDYDHVDGIHIMPYENEPFSVIPDNFRNEVYEIFNKYSNGIYKLKNSEWVKLD